MLTRIRTRWLARISGIVACAVLILIPAVGVAQPVSPPDPDDWNQFLGPERNGIARSARGLPNAWPDDGPKEMWRVTGGVGMSGIATGESRVCTLVQKDGQQCLIALNVETGKQQWQTAIAP